jgi:hypothetical protein
MGDILREPYQNEPQFEPRDPLAHPAGVPDARLGGLMQEHIPSLVVRDSSGTSSASSSSSTGESSGGSSIVTPAVVGTIVPLAIAVIVIIFLHRRHVRKLRQEDAEDKHGSLDFGLGEGRRHQPSKSRWKKQPPPPRPEMDMVDAMALRKERGMSLDLGQNPYLLPPGLNHSRESLHSMSRSQRLGDDKYQRTNFIPDDGSIRSPSIRQRNDDSSSFSGSTRLRNDADSSRSLVNNATGMPSRPTPPPKVYSPAPASRTASPNPANLLAPIPQQDRESMVSTTGNTAAFRASNDYLSAYIRGGANGQQTKEEKKEDTVAEPVVVTEREVIETPPVEARAAPAPLPAIVMNDAPLEFGRLSTYSDHQPSPVPEQEPERPARTTSMGPGREAQLPQLSVMDFDSQSSTPQERSREPSAYGGPKQSYTPEDRSRETSTYDNSQLPTAAHSREQSQAHGNSQYEDESDYYDPEDTYSVYDEYDDQLGYDPRRLTWGMRPLPPEDPSDNPEQRANRIRSFYKEYFEDTGKPGAAGPMQYYDGSEEYYDDYYYGGEEYYPPRGMSAAGGRHRAMSNGSYMRPGPRAFSSASGRYGMPPPRGGPRKAPKKRAPPPKALNELPTPHKLKDDTFLIDMAVDFAPPDKARFQRSGTPSSPRGGQRPYSPSVRAFTPLQSSYDDLAVLPSP